MALLCVTHDVSASGQNTTLTTLSASGHAVPASALSELGAALKTKSSKLIRISIGDSKMGDGGVVSLCEALVDGGLLEYVDFSWKGL